MESIDGLGGDVEDKDTVENKETNTFRQYIFFLGGQLFSRLGSIVVQFVLVLWIAFETQDELLLGLASVAGFGPFLILGPIAGVLVDRLNRKAIIIISDAGIALTTLAAIYLFYTNTINLVWYFLIIVIRGIGDVFHYTTTNALMPTMVPQKHLSRMNGVSYLANGAISVIGPAMAGGLIALFNEIGRLDNVAYADLLWIDIITFAIALIPLLIITIPKVATTIDKGEKISFFKDFNEGLKVIGGIKGMIPLLIMFMFVNFFITPLGTLMPLFINKTHGGFEAEYAIVTAFLQAGMLLGGLVMTFFKGFRRKGLSSYISILWVFGIICTLILIPTDLAGRFWIIGAILFMGTIVLPLINVSMITAIQMIVPQESLGRASSVLGTISSAITPIAMLLAGVIGKFVDIPWVYLGSSVLGILTSSILWFLTKAPQIDDSIIEVMEKHEKMRMEQPAK